MVLVPAVILTNWSRASRLCLCQLAKKWLREPDRGGRVPRKIASNPLNGRWTGVPVMGLEQRGDAGKCVDPLHNPDEF